MHGELYLFGAHIPEYQQAGKHLNHEPRRHRKLLVSKKQRDHLIGSVTREGYTIVPVSLYFNTKGLAKIQIALAKGKKEHDKRDTEKEREWGRQKNRLLRDRG